MRPDTEDSKPARNFSPGTAEKPVYRSTIAEVEQVSDRLSVDILLCHSDSSDL